MKLSDIKLGSFIEVFAPNKAQLLSGRIMKHVDEDKIVVRTIKMYQTIELIKMNERNLVTITVHDGVLGSIVSFIKAVPKDDYFLILMKFMTEIKRTQPRSSFRAVCDIPVKVMALGSGGGSGSHGMVIEGRIKDISIGGMKLYSNADLIEKTAFTWLIDMDGEEIYSVCQVVKKIASRDPNYTYQYGVKFLGNLEDDEKKIAEFITRLQRKEALKAKK